MASKPGAGSGMNFDQILMVLLRPALEDHAQSDRPEMSA